MKECSWVAGNYNFCRVQQIRVHSLHVLTNTMILSFEFALRIDIRKPGLSCSVVKMQFWISVLTVFLPWKVENFTKSSFMFNSYFRRFPQKFQSMVAVAKRVCLREGMAPIILCILGSIFSSNSLSASSSTSTSTLLSSSINFSDFVSISASLPGVATMICGYFSSCSNCMRQLTPPTMSANLRLMLCPKMLICQCICIASSRLGAMMTAKMLVGSLASSFRIGRPNAAVLPEPVSELMMTLFPCRIWGIVNAWMGVGVLYLIFSQVLSTQLDNLSLLNELILLQYQTKAILKVKVKVSIRKTQSLQFDQFIAWLIYLLNTIIVDYFSIKQPLTEQMPQQRFKYILQLQLEGYSQTYRMGNSIQQKSSLLVKNWVKIDTSTYRNSITQELIDEHIIEYSSQDQMQANHTQLISRANISHPNVIKLIYFCQDSQKGFCIDKLYRHKVFIEHQNQQLPQYLTAVNRSIQYDKQNTSDCFCCPIINAFSYLSQKYGFFEVRPSMILLVSQIKWHRNHDKKTVKVWINSKLQQSRPEKQCKQEEMCENLREIYQSIANSGVCNKVKNIHISKNFKLQQFLEEVYRAHNNTYQRPIEGKKRVLSTYSSSNPNILKSLPEHQSSQDTLMLFKSNLIFNPNEPDPTARNHTQANEEEAKKDEIQTAKKIIPLLVTRKIIPAQKSQRQHPISPFYRPQNASKVNFAYNDLFSTPKQHRNSQQEVNSTSPCIIISHPPAFTTSKPQTAGLHQQAEKMNKRQSEQAKTPKLERMTVNVKVESQTSMKQLKQSNEGTQIVSAQPSEECLKKKLAQILQSEEHIPSSPFLIDTNQPNQNQIEQHCAESINQSDFYSKNQIHQEITQQNPQFNFQYESEAPQIHVEQPVQNKRYYAEPSNIPLSESIRESEKSDRNEERGYSTKQPIPTQYFTSFQKETAQEGIQVEQTHHPVPNFGLMTSPPVLLHTSKHDKSSKKSLDEYQQIQQPYNQSISNSEYSRLDTNYSKYLKKFNKAMNPISPRSKFSSGPPPFQSMPSHSAMASRKIPYPNHLSAYNKYNSLNLQDNFGRRKSKSKCNEMEMSAGQHQKVLHSGELESLYNQSVNSQEEKKAKIIERIENTEKIIRENRKKLQKIELQKDLQREKEIIKKEMQSLLKNNLMADESNRIKEKVKYKKATFAQLKAEASKILEDLNF